MADVIRSSILSPSAIIPFGETVRTELATGLSSGPYGFIIHDPDNESLANQIADGVDTLTVAIDKPSISDDGIDEAVITCDELVTDMDYNIYRDNQLHLSGSVIDGSIEYSSNTPGSYVFEIIEPGTYNTGYVALEVI